MTTLSNPPDDGPQTFGSRIGALAALHPDKVAIHFVGADGARSTTTWSELDGRSNQVARYLRRIGVSQGSVVAVGLANTPRHYVVTLAAWKVGACVIPVKADLPVRELSGVVAAGRVSLVVVEDPGTAAGLGTAVTVDTIERAAAELPDGPVPDVVAHPGKAIGSGGSTGTPKIIIDTRPWAFRPGEFGGYWGSVGFRNGMVQLVPGPLSHNAPFLWSYFGLFDGHELVLMERFDAARAVDLIEEHGVGFVMTVPTVMHRILDLPDIARRDLSSISTLIHTAGPCPPWVKKAWIELLGPERVFEAYGASEAVGHTLIRGDEWLRHEGSVGRPVNCDIRIEVDDEVVPVGEVGEIFIKLREGTAPYRYGGGQVARVDAAGYTSVGDLGRVDADGYLYLADRRTDLIISGGVNIYPAEVEAVLTEHPAVRDAVVIGLPDADWGKRVHAVVETDGSDVGRAGLEAFARERVASYKVPKSYEFVERTPRDSAGKINRSAMIAARTTPADGGEAAPAPAAPVGGTGVDR